MLEGHYLGKEIGQQENGRILLLNQAILKNAEKFSVKDYFEYSIFFIKRMERPENTIKASGRGDRK